MMGRLIAAVVAMTLAVLVAACTEERGNVAAKTEQHVVGEWKSESVTRQGTITAKFREDGTCYIRESTGAQQSCTWTALAPGQSRISITVQGRSEATHASLDGDRLFINEPGRDTYFARETGYKLLSSLRPLFSDK